MEKKFENQFYADMGFRLKKLRQNKKISQIILAQSLGVVTQTIQKYESGEVKMSPEVIHYCAKLFKTPVGYFYGEDTILLKQNRVTLMLASEISRLPSNDIKKNLYQLIRSINHTST